LANFLAASTPTIKSLWLNLSSIFLGLNSGKLFGSIDPMIRSSKFLTSAMALLLACALHPQVANAESVSTTDMTNAGYLVGTIGKRTWGPFGSSSFVLNQINFSSKVNPEKTAGSLRFITGMFSNNTSVDIESDGIRATAFAIPLNAGEYELRDIGFTSNDGGPIRRVPAGNFSVPFQIKPNQVVYIGAFEACVLADCRKVNGGPYPVGFFWLGNQFERDIKVIKNKFPELEKLVTMEQVSSTSVKPYIFLVGTPLGE
jgi:hypothetical protein